MHNARVYPNVGPFCSFVGFPERAILQNGNLGVVVVVIVEVDLVAVVEFEVDFGWTVLGERWVSLKILWDGYLQALSIICAEEWQENRRTIESSFRTNCFDVYISNRKEKRIWTGREKMWSQETEQKRTMTSLVASRVCKLFPFKAWSFLWRLKCIWVLSREMKNSGHLLKDLQDTDPESATWIHPFDFYRLINLDTAQYRSCKGCVSSSVPLLGIILITEISRERRKPHEEKWLHSYNLISAGLWDIFPMYSFAMKELAIRYEEWARSNIRRWKHQDVALHWYLEARENT